MTDQLHTEPVWRCPLPFDIGRRVEHRWTRDLGVVVDLPDDGSRIVRFDADGSEHRLSIALLRPPRDEQ